MSIYPFIEAEKVAERNVASACALMEVSRSAFYGWHHHQPGPRARANAKLEAKIVEIHAKSRATYGAPRIRAALAREGDGVGRKRVARLMALRGLAGRHRRRKIRTTIPDPEANPTMVDRLGRAFHPESVALDRTYIGDITYIRTHEGWLYLATCIDLASRRVVGFSMADHMRASLVVDALTMAIRARHRLDLRHRLSDRPAAFDRACRASRPEGDRASSRRGRRGDRGDPVSGARHAHEGPYPQ